MDFESRDFKKKRVYHQLAKKYNLPIDIILFIYNIVRKDTIKEFIANQNFYCNILSLNIVDPYISLNRINNNNFIPNYNYWSFENIYKYRIPIGKNLEWLISCNINNFYNKMNNRLWNDISDREKILYEIKIFASEGFLEEFSYHRDGDINIIKATSESKLSYIKNTEFRHLYSDYHSHIDNGHTLTIDNE